MRDAAARGSPPVLVLDWRSYGREEDVLALVVACLKGTVRLPRLFNVKEVMFPLSNLFSSSFGVVIAEVRIMADINMFFSSLNYLQSFFCAMMAQVHIQ